MPSKLIALGQVAFFMALEMGLKGQGLEHLRRIFTIESDR